MLYLFLTIRKCEPVIKEECGRGLDGMLANGVSEMEFELIKKGSRKRSLTGLKLTYARETLEVNYTLKEIKKYPMWQ